MWPAEVNKSLYFGTEGVYFSLPRLYLFLISSRSVCRRAWEGSGGRRGGLEPGGLGASRSRGAGERTRSSRVGGRRQHRWWPVTARGRRGPGLHRCTRRWHRRIVADASGLKAGNLGASRSGWRCRRAGRLVLALFLSFYCESSLSFFLFADSCVWDEMWNLFVWMWNFFLLFLLWNLYEM
jgi:hypothetical protein